MRRHSGLALAYDLRDLELDIHVLEADDDIGGRTRSVQLAGAAVNAGAMFTIASVICISQGITPRKHCHGQTHSVRGSPRSFRRARSMNGHPFFGILIANPLRLMPDGSF